MGVPKVAGLYAILAYDPPYRLLYFGESADLASRVTSSHEHYSSWRHEPGTGTLCVAYTPMPNSTWDQRRAVESALIAYYNTPYNKRQLTRTLRTPSFAQRSPGHWRLVLVKERKENGRLTEFGGPADVQNFFYGVDGAISSIAEML